MTDSPTPLATWRGDFGHDYADRNQVTDDARHDAAVAFGRMLDGVTGVGSVLEVGANVGINITGVRAVLDEATVTAVEPSGRAASVLAAGGLVDSVVMADGALLPFADDAFDLVFTNGVLIHVPPDRLPLVMGEIARVARRYVLCSEYFAHIPEEIPYRGVQGLLWKRDFGSAYLDTCPGLTVDAYGFLWQRELPVYDDLTWWRFRT